MIARPGPAFALLVLLEDAVKQISAIESRLGLADIGQFTAPPPPQA
jgi:hypothetical protein